MTGFICRPMVVGCSIRIGVNAGSLEKHLLEKYGERARFVLTVRDPDEWYDSLVRHNRYAHPVTHGHKFIFGRFYPHGFRTEATDQLKRHNEAVQDYAARLGVENQLLVLETGTADGLEALNRFVNTGVELSEYPRSNVSAKRKKRDLFDRFRVGYNAVVQPAYGRYAPRLRANPGKRLKPAPASAAHHG